MPKSGKSQIVLIIVILERIVGTMPMKKKLPMTHRANHRKRLCLHIFAGVRLSLWQCHILARVVLARDPVLGTSNIHHRFLTNCDLCSPPNDSFLNEKTAQYCSTLNSKIPTNINKKHAASNHFISVARLEPLQFCPPQRSTTHPSQ